MIYMRHLAVRKLRLRIAMSLKALKVSVLKGGIFLPVPNSLIYVVLPKEAKAKVIRLKKMLFSMTRHIVEEI